MQKPSVPYTFPSKMSFLSSGLYVYVQLFHFNGNEKNYYFLKNIESIFLLIF